ncbi:electron transfer flavoprotein subunit alpha/FixB family protein [Pseudarthrobacter sp. PS3-L1]|uniref:electron transfer flavoprotein subunit alpha/FixB family protein n=1 Tax=Pseudarthrobacter sp. PS3-L1 TaxID=3046207 RepID=UPI0024BAAD11|nr:electron transfer flavoprotein subunit alpha/FixB family protein [Pseudarthrobacter sp. PS3-L1]MDJ0321463.1 electron transfer flavoprotein subunit alpha/FixB family protein [Pseudarthrobacter sp. PS3-L1]
MEKVLVFIDSPADSLKKTSQELLTLAQSMGQPVAAVAGDLSPAVRSELGSYGVGSIVVAADARLADFVVAPKAAFLASAATASGATVVLVENSPEGKEIAARTGIRLNAGVITDVVSVDADGTAHKSVLAGSYTTAARVSTAMTVLTVKANTVTVRAVGGGEPETVTVDVPADSFTSAARITSRTGKTASGRPELTDARVVVAGGRGVDGDFEPIELLADALGGAVGASRAATDAGWISHDAQVGQTGKTVSPELYISAGISGAIQQKAGMQTAKIIIAVNKDADSPVFEIADFGIVGDLHTVLPQAAAEIRKRQG